MKNEKFYINNAEYSPKNVLIIAEIGTSHGGNAEKAEDLIAAAAEAGANCIKFQIVYAHEILHPNTGEVTLPGGKIRLYDRFKELELDPSFFERMKEIVEKKGLTFLCTPFGLQSARELKDLNPACIKIASPELNYTSLLEEIGSYKLPTLLSTGVSRLGDIEEALLTLAKTQNLASFSNSTCLLHCVTSYPAPEEDYNLAVLKSLSTVFGVPVGVSDHSLSPCLVPVLAQVFGAAVIEKHFCLSRSDSGLDDPIALPPSSFAKMVKELRLAEKNSPEDTLAGLKKEYGAEKINRIIGSGIKKLAPSEEANYRRTNRSLHALRDIKKGEIIDESVVAVLRTEKILRPGLPPSFEKHIIGKTAKDFIPAGEGIRFEDIC